uniref:Putative group vii salivary lipocalin n=1 Tax=Rhipicephalus pulchellus TaxID=72859 RepID=L7MBK9_RHIPC
MGCNITQLVVLLCYLSPVHMNVDCENKVPCGVDGTSPEKTCPGVGVSCEKGKDVCACPDTQYRSSNGFQCVNYEDCVTKKFDTHLLLKETADLYLVGLNSLLLSKASFRCMRCQHHSSYKDLTQVERGLVYLERVKKTVQERSEEPQADSTNSAGWHHRERKLVLWMQNNNSHELYIRYEPTQANEKAESDVFRVLHATDKCLIVAAGPTETGKFECTLWAKKNDILYLPFDCTFIFEQQCNNPAIVRDIEYFCESSSQ